MNFFEQQDQARRLTRRLILLFILAVIAIVIAVNVTMALIWIAANGGDGYDRDIYPRGFFFANTFITLALIGVGTLVETWNLREGGDAVAKMAGGRLVSTATRDLQERRLLNVVEEMALASGIACPKVYLLEREEAINAFAAGYNQNEAVVAVTRGALHRLTRDELQGVVAHEFSHILNGDMRLNVRLIGVLFGIQMVASFGQHLMDFAARMSVVRSRDRNDKGPSLQVLLLLAGLALLIIGYIGIFFGRLIKAAVSRQREFLADASAVQFTRNADGIGGALRKIGGLSRSMTLGSRIEHPNAEQLSHLFLGAPKKSLAGGFFATHPPLEERLRRIYGKSVAMLDAPQLPDEQASEPLPDIPYVASAFVGPSATDTTGTAAAHDAPTATAAAAAPAFASGEQHASALPQALVSAIHEPEAARAVVYALLLDEGAAREPQLAVLQAEAPKQAAFAAFLADTLRTLPKSARLPLLDLAMPALKQLPEAARSELLDIARKLIAADRRTTLAEFVLQTVLTRRLDIHAGRAIPVRYHRLAALRSECAVLLSLVAQLAARVNGETADQAFGRGVTCCAEPGWSPDDLLPVEKLRFAQIKHALDQVNQVAPLAKPALVKALLAATGPAEPMAVDSADLLRAICAAIEVPIPPAVAATYSAHRW